MDNFDFDKLLKEISAGNMDSFDFNRFMSQISTDGIKHNDGEDNNEHKRFKNNQCPRCGYRLSKEQFELWSVNTTDEQREELD